MKKNHSVEFQALWQDNRYNRAPLLSTILLRMVIAVAFVLFIIENIFKASTALMVGIAIILVCMMMLSISVLYARPMLVDLFHSTGIEVMECSTVKICRFMMNWNIMD